VNDSDVTEIRIPHSDLLPLSMRKKFALPDTQSKQPMTFGKMHYVIAQKRGSLILSSVGRGPRRK
jgi:hypothetical protein